MKRGIYGGSFDPVHFGHLLLAETARAEIGLDRVVFLPLGVPPHQKNVRTSGEDRFAMLEAAVAPYPEFEVGRYEIDSPNTSYTADTLRYYRETYPDDELFLIVGSETFNDVPRWVRPREICGLASLIVARRAGFPPPDFDLFREIAPPERIEAFRRQVVEMPALEISSTAIRQRVAAGRSVRFLTPDVVADYIESRRLYRD
jgi:nicotinate-nucleotide adenylyltransferase